MRRLAAPFLVMSLGGCSCFDQTFERYTAFCRDAGTCGAEGDGGGGGPGGGPTRLNLEGVIDLPSSTCRNATVTLRDANNNPATFPGPTTVTLADLSGGVTFFDHCPPSENMITDLGVPANSFAMQFAYNGVHFGLHTMQASMMNLTSTTATFTASAKVSFQKAGYAISDTAACSPVEIVARAQANGNQEVVSNDIVSLSVSSPSPTLFYGLDSSACDTPMTALTLSFPAGVNKTVVYARSTAAMMTLEPLTVTASGGGLTDFENGKLYVGCIPTGGLCSLSPDCCSAMACDAGICGN